MNEVELLTVSGFHSEDEEWGLTIKPYLETASDTIWKNTSVKVKVKTPNGDSRVLRAYLHMGNFRYVDPETEQAKACPILVTIKKTTKDLIPIGSKLYVDKELKPQLKA